MTVTINRSDLDLVMMGVKSLKELISTGAAKIEGDPSVLSTLAEGMIHFELRFEILPGTGSKEEKVSKNPYQQEGPAVIGGE